MGQLDLSDGPGSRDHRQDRQDRPKVKKWKVGDTVGVGCFVDSDRHLRAKSNIARAARPSLIMAMSVTGRLRPMAVIRPASPLTRTTCSRSPKALDRAAPLLCAGITTHSPLKHFGLKKGDKLDVVGLGGLGHMGRQVRPRHGRGRHRTQPFARQTPRRDQAWSRRFPRYQRRERVQGECRSASI
jgi:hypothetical protein